MARTRPEDVWRRGTVIAALAVVLAQSLEPMGEVALALHRLGYPNEPARWTAFFVCLAAGLPAYFAALWWCRPRRDARTARSPPRPQPNERFAVSPHPHTYRYLQDRVEAGDLGLSHDPRSHRSLLVYHRALEWIEERSAQLLRHVQQSLMVDEKARRLVRHHITTAPKRP